MLALALAGALVLAACGDDGDDNTTSAGGRSDVSATPAPSASGGAATTTAEADDVDPNGVLRIGTAVSSPNVWDNFDLPTLAVPPVDVHRAVYGTLLRQHEDGSLHPGLAEAVTVVDPSTLRVVLRPGVRFTDGTPYDAEAVKFGLERHVAAANARAFAAELQQIDTMTVDDPLTLTITLKRPIAGYIQVLFARGESSIPSPTAVRNGVDLKTTPVGAGPFVLDTVVPNQLIRIVKNPDYIDADEVRLAAVEYVVLSGEPLTMSNAVRSGAVDVVHLGSPTLELLEGLGNSVASRFEVTDSVLLWGQLRKTNPPLDDVRVRQALNFGIDRDAINQALFQGQSEPAMGFLRSSSPNFDPALADYWTHDVERAKALLAEAGVTELTIEGYAAAGLGQRFAEIVQQQWQDIGVNLEIRSSQQVVQDFFIDGKGDINFYGMVNPPLQGIQRNLQPGTIGNVGSWSHDEVNALVAELQALPPDSPQAVQPWRRLQKVILDQAPNVFGVFGMKAAAWRDERVGDVSWVLEYNGGPFIDLQRVYIRT